MSSKDPNRRIQALIEHKRFARADRDRLVTLLAHMARLLGWNAGQARLESDDPAHADSPPMLVVRVDLPTGQVSWPVHFTNVHLLEGLPTYAGSYDGTGTREKHERVEAAYDKIAALDAPLRSAKPFWWHWANSEYGASGFATREAALEHAQQFYEEGDQFFVARVLAYAHEDLAGTYSDLIADRAKEIADATAVEYENWPGSTAEQDAELNAAVERVLKHWVNKNEIGPPTFGDVEEGTTETHTCRK